MVNWQHLFSGTVLKRGSEYYSADAVGEIEARAGGVFRTEVYGSDVYDVEIEIRDNRVTAMSCTCPYAEDGRRCKHMAAVLYKMNSEGLLSGDVGREAPGADRAERRRIRPFAHEESLEGGGAYRYFRIERITERLFIYEDAWEKARKVRRDMKPGQAQFDFRYALGCSGEMTLTGRVSTGNGFYDSASVTFDSTGVKDMMCRSGECARSRPEYGRERFLTPCEHEIALLMCLDEYLKANNPGDSTSYAAGRMLREYKSKLMGTGKSAGGEEKTATIEPRLQEDDTGLRLSFKVGQPGCMYVLKDMPAIVRAVENGEEMELGSKLTLNFAADVLDEAGRAYYRIIKRYVNETERRGGAFSSSFGGVGTKQDILLYGLNLDEFFDLAVGTQVECSDRSNAGRKAGGFYSISHDPPPVKLLIEPDRDGDGVCHGIRLTGSLPALLEGESCEYLLQDRVLARTGSGAVEALRPLISNAGKGDLDMTIGRRNLTEFYHDILPGLRGCAEITELADGEIESLVPPEAEFTFYLDAEDGVPVCRGEARYGESAYSLADWFRHDVPILNSRDEIREVTAARTVCGYFPTVNITAGKFICAEDQDSVYRAVTEGADRLSGIGAVMSTNAFDSIKVRRRVQIKVGVSLESDLMNLTLTSEGIPPEELYELLKSYRLKKNYHRLKNGEFVTLDESIAELGMMVDALRLTPREFIRGNINVPAYRALYLDRMLEQCSDIYYTRDQHYRNLVKEFKTVGESDFEVPESLEDVMRPYQKHGYKWIRTLASNSFGGILADDMGLGKTLQMIAVLLAERDEGTAGTSLVVCPASLVFNWADEFARFAPTLKVCPVAGTQGERRAVIERYAKWDVLVTSYDLIKRDAPLYENAVFLYEILDEAQYIKTHSTAAAKSVKIIKSRHRMALTGTPIENRLSELWSIFDFLMPGFLYGYESFRSELEMPIARKHDEDASARLRRMVSPFILRRLKEDVLKDLPPKTEETRLIRLGDAQQKLYDAQVVHMKELVSREDEESFSKSRIRILAELTKIRQICCDPSLLFENYEGGSAKREAVRELVLSAIDGGHKILLFSQFTSMLSLLKGDLESAGVSYYEITGATPKQDRLTLVNRFNSGDVPVFLVSLKAGGTGLNLTGADIVIHYDPWWNAAAQNQATDRAHRIGQTKPVTVFKLIAKNSIEEKIQKMQEMKMSLADEIISGDAASLASLTREELLELIS